MLQCYLIIILALTLDADSRNQGKNSPGDGDKDSVNVKITYYMYSRSNRGGVKINNERLPKDFDHSLPTYLIIHGMSSNHNTPCQRALRSAFLDREGANVIVPNYTNSSTLYTVFYQEVARRVGKFMVKEGIDGSNTRVVGASLGAHVAGVMKRTSGFRPREIYGLDPAGPIFERLPENQRLAVESADYVQAFHTNAGRFGIISPVANDDVYVNGGNGYPCCTSNACRHNGACEIFVRSIRKGPFQTRLCDSVREARSSSCKGSSHQVGFGSRSTLSRKISHLQLERCFDLSGS